MKKYCYKVKFNYLKVDDMNAYKKALIEQYDFSPMYEELDEGISSWAQGWAKSISIKSDSSIGKWLKKNVEGIYKKVKDIPDSKWKKEILESGYEFDAEGNLIENEITREDVQAQLCIMATGDFKGMLFINVGGAMEIYEAETLLECVPEEINKLVNDKVAYLRRFYE